MPKFESANAAEIPTSVGGMLFMLTALLSLAAVIAGQFWAMRGYVWSGLPWRETRDPTGPEFFIALGVTLVVTAFAGLFPYQLAKRKVRAGAV